MSAEFLTANPLQHPGLKHGFFTRNGGVSTGAFASLNCSLSGKDDAAAVRETWSAKASQSTPPGDRIGSRIADMRAT